MRASTKRYLLSWSAAIAVLGLSLLTLWQIKRTSHVQYPDLHPGTYGLFFLSVATIYALSLFLWCFFFALFGQRRNRKDAFIDMGFIAIGKYVPGKIWGLLLRGSIEQQQIKLDKNKAAISVMEQIFSLCLGVILVALLLSFRHYLDHLPVFVFCFFCTAGISVSVLPIASWCTSRIKQLSIQLLLPPAAERFFLGLGYALLWTLSAVPILILMQASISLETGELLSIAAAFLASMIVGWLAIFAPGGIGVRESIFVLLAPDFLSWQEALYWIALHRGLFTLFDAVYGSICLGMLAVRNRQVASR